MKKAHFHAYGLIGEADPLFKVFTGETDPVISSQRVVEFLSANQDAEEIVVHINSRGGSVDEGFAIHDLFSTSGKKITTIVEGQAYSIASVVALCGTVRQITENSKIGIHNPWIDPTIIAGLEADELLKMGNDMKREENRIIDFYVSKTAGERTVIAEMMKKDTAMDAAKSLELKFVTEIVKPEPVKALAYYNYKSKTEDIMNKDLKAFSDKMTGMFNTVLTAINKKAKPTDDAQAADTDAAATEVETQSAKHTTNDGKTINVDGPLEVGSMVTDEAGNPTPDASYTFEDGTVITTDADSKISKVTPPAAAATDDATADAATKAENVDLKKQLKDQAEVQKQMLAQMEKIMKAVQSKHVHVTGQNTVGVRGEGSSKGTSLREMRRKEKEAAAKK